MTGMEEFVLRDSGLPAKGIPEANRDDVGGNRFLFWRFGWW